MPRVVFFVDGFNLYHALKANPALGRYRWLDLRRLAECFVKDPACISDVLYFTALASWDPDKVARHRLLIKALENRGVKVVYGEFRRRTRRCRSCRKLVSTYEEKETDVNIAMALFEYGYKDLYDTAMIVSGDSDLLPAIRRVRACFPGKQFCILVPPGRRAEHLKDEADAHKKIKEKHLRASRFPDVLDLGGGATLVCPEKWR